MNINNANKHYIRIVMPERSTDTMSGPFIQKSATTMRISLSRGEMNIQVDAIIE